MTFNALLDDKENIVRMPGEYLVLKNKSCNFSVSVNGGLPIDGIGSVGLVLSVDGADVF